MSIEVQGNLKKLSHSLDENNLVQYSFRVSQDSGAKIIQEQINSALGKKIQIKFLDEINCVACNRSIKKSFNNGYCFPCLNTLAECDVCIIKPELCHFDKGTCRDNDFAEEHCNISHSVYLSITSGIKIGITRQHQETSRWIDQGATKARRIFSVKRRYHAGLVESLIAKSLPDKTNWRKMLKNESDDIDIDASQSFANEIVASALETKVFVEDLNYLLDQFREQNPIQEIHYPVLEFPTKVTSFNLDSNPLVEGVLLGIKAQYLILDTGVINMRKYAGYKIKFVVL